MNDWAEFVAVCGIAASLVVVTYGLASLQIQVFTILLTKYAQLTAKFAQLISNCIDDYLLLVSPDMIAITIVY